MSSDLLKVARGLRLVFIGLMIVVAAIVIGIVGGVALVALAVGQAGGGGGGGIGGMVVPIAIFAVVVGGLSLVGRVMGLVGRFFCLATPPQAAGARQRIIVSVILEVSSLVVGLVQSVDDIAGHFLPSAARIIVGGLAVLMTFASGILFLLFIKALAEFVRRSKLGEEAMEVLKLFIGTAGCYLLGLVISLVAALAVQGGGNPGLGLFGCVSLVAMIAALVMGVIGLVKYSKLLTGLSEAVRKYAKKQRKYEDDEEEEEEVEDAEEDEDERPSRRRRQEPEDDLDEDRPLHRRRKDDDEEDDRPSRRRRDDD